MTERKRVYLLLLGYEHCVRYWLLQRGRHGLPPHLRQWRHVTGPEQLMNIPRKGMAWLQVGPETSHASLIREALRYRGVREMGDVSAIDLMGTLVAGEET